MWSKSVKLKEGKNEEKIDVFIRGKQQARGIIMDGLDLKTFTQAGEDTRGLSRIQQLLTAHPAALPSTQ